MGTLPNRQRRYRPATDGARPHRRMRSRSAATPATSATRIWSPLPALSHRW